MKRTWWRRPWPWLLAVTAIPTATVAIVFMRDWQVPAFRFGLLSGAGIAIIATAWVLGADAQMDANPPAVSPRRAIKEDK